MANLPQCPSFTEGRGCERSDLVLAVETPRFWRFICRTCSTDWVQSKPRAKQEAEWRAWEARLEKASAADRERAARRAYSFGSGRGAGGSSSDGKLILEP
jgi:hypothetical protein